MKDYVLEVCVDSVTSAINAQKGGATRLELCGPLLLGGITPTQGLVKMVKAHTTIPVFAMLRPRIGDFCYTDSEFEWLLDELDCLLAQDVDGIVCGVLTPHGELDLQKMKVIIDKVHAHDKHFTLHRAFDMTVDAQKSLKDAISLGVDTILTAGHQDKAPLGVDCLEALIQQANRKVDILIGSGVTVDNVTYLHQTTGARSFHLSGATVHAGDMLYKKEHIHMGLKEFSEYDIRETDEKIIKQMTDILSVL
ncbi:copper homeostasis protein CutC [Carnobacteriaceae bacterium zg-ZUI78]|nr:copper homeostasis protein CutC [Carnobacteriaceae bacterium zg-ZUI78]